MSVCGPKAAHHIYETVHCCCFFRSLSLFFFLEISNVFLHMLLMKGLSDETLLLYLGVFIISDLSIQIYLTKSEAV